MYSCVYVYIYTGTASDGVAMISRLLQIIGLFCRILPVCRALLPVKTAEVMRHVLYV